MANFGCTTFSVDHGRGGFSGYVIEAIGTKGCDFSKTFDHPGIAVDDVAPYSKVAAVR